MLGFELGYEAILLGIEEGSCFCSSCLEARPFDCGRLRLALANTFGAYD